MIEKISQSKNPAEATAAMVAALATSTRFGNQRKLLLELTKKVDEQKKLLEQKRTKLGQSPVTSSPGSSGSTPQPKTKLSKDPRIRKQEMAAAASAAAAKEVESFLGGELEDLDLRNQGSVPQSFSSTGTTINQSTTVPVSQSAESSASSTILTSSLLKESVSSLLSLTSAISSSTNAADSVNQVAKSAQGTSAAATNSPDPRLKPKGFYKEHVEDKGKTESLASIVDLDNKEKVTQVDSNKTEQGETVKTADESSNQNVQYDVVSQLQAEISGKPVVSDSAKFKDKPDQGSDKVSAEGAKTSSESSSSTSVPNVTSLFKNLASGNSDSGKKAGIQLPTALMSLFSKLPGSAEEPVDAEANQEIPGLFSAEESDSGKVKKGDDSEKHEMTELPGLGGFGDTDEREGVEKSKSGGKSSKSFLGFHYDSDSSDGSFEGFDDDGTRKLSPRKRKLVQKSSKSELETAGAQKTNLFGDVDEREEQNIHNDEDLRDHKVVEEDVDFRNSFQKKDIDERINIVPPPGVVTTTQGLPFHPPHPALSLPFITSDQPPPPGEEWNVPPQPVIPPMSMAMTQMPHQEWAPPMPIAEPPVDLPPQPPLPAEPPAPKPPEPPVKKKKPEEDLGSDEEGSTSKGKKKKKKKDKKKKGGTSSSDERLKQIVLEIAKKEPINPPPVPPATTRLIPGQYSMPSQPMMPMIPPMTSMMNPVGSQEGMWDGGTSMGPQGWQAPGIGPGMNTQAALNPQPLPPHMQPGVTTSGPPMMPMGGPGFGPMGMAGPGALGPAPVQKPPSLLDLPTIPAPKKLKSHRSSDSPSSRDSQRNSREFSEPVETPAIDATAGKGDGHATTDQEKRDREGHSKERDDRGRDREDRHRHDRYRSRSRDRDRDRHRRSRSYEKSRDHHRHRSSHDRDRHYRRGRR